MIIGAITWHTSCCKEIESFNHLQSIREFSRVNIFQECCRAVKNFLQPDCQEAGRAGGPPAAVASLHVPAAPPPPRFVGPWGWGLPGAA